MKLRKRIAAFGAAMVMAVSMMSIEASASVPSYWSVHGGSDRPHSSWKPNDDHFVTGLTLVNDSGLDFNANNYSSPTGASYVICSCDYGAYTGTINDLNDTPFIPFTSGWYSTTGGSIHYYINGYNLGATGNNYISGFAS